MSLLLLEVMRVSEAAMKCYEVIDKLEELSPLMYAEEWDNVGLLAGRRDK